MKLSISKENILNGTFALKFRISDDNSTQKSSFQLIVRVIYPNQTKYEPVQYLPAAEETEIKTNLSAKIKSIGFFGEMKILFNETIKVDFNYSELF